MTGFRNIVRSARGCAMALGVLSSLILGGGTDAAEEIDPTKLPPPANTEIDFTRDVRPILENTCLRCHGPQKPKSHFRLDNRRSALEGGDNGVDIIPGNSAESPLIHNVAGLVEDMQMPPQGKGEPLTPQQIGVLRAWIDQGASWGTNAPEPAVQSSVTTSLRWIGVKGDKSKFREVEGLREGWGGGVEHFESQENDGADQTLSIEGRVLPRDNDYMVKLTLEKPDVGFVHGGFETWRKYYNDNGGFAPMLPTNSYSLNRDLHLDIGRLWFDLGSTLPNRPQVVLGYEYQFKLGDKSMLEWGPAGSGADEKNVVPAAKHVDEKVQIVKLDVTHQISGWELEDNARVEFYHLQTARQNAPADFSGSPPGGVLLVAEQDQHIQGMNTFSVNKQLTSWLFASGGYLYSRLDGSASFRQNSVDSSGAPSSGDQWSANIESIKRESHVASLSGLLGPWSGLALSLGVQGEWTRQETSGNEDLLGEIGAFTNHAPSILIGNTDDTLARENAALRFTKIPYTVLFAEGRLLQESLGRYYEGQTLSDLGPSPFTRTIDADIRSEEYRFGFDTSPWRHVSFGASFRHTEKRTDYNNSPLDPSVDPFYPGYILWRDTAEDQTQARLVWRPATWLKTALNCRFKDTDFHSATPPIPDVGAPGGALETAKQQAQVYSFDLVLTPFRQWYLAATFSYTQSRIATAVDNLGPVVPYQGHVYTVLGSATYAVNSRTDLNLSYLFSQSDYAQDNQATGLPLGIDYQRHDLRAGVTRRFGKNLTANLVYSYSMYHEPTSGNANDFTAQGVFASVTMAWP